MEFKKYIFKSQRLGFRLWEQNDLSVLAAINADTEVMQFFPRTISAEKTKDFMATMAKMYAQVGFCYYAVDILAEDKCIGFIGLSEVNFSSDFTPCVDIGWRLARPYWNKGLATEGAERCLQHGFEQLNLDTIFAICPEVNIISERVMKKIGMVKVQTFMHPYLGEYPQLESCVLYKIVKI